MIKPNIQIRPSQERGHANHGWLDSYFTFSFADYHDPAHMQFRSLRVINEDRIAVGKGFGMHPHRDMEIFTYVIEGQLAHKDSIGHASSLKAGQIQKITAGRGISHSEFNGSADSEVHLLQIWIVPQKRGLTPSYEEYDLAKPDENHPLTLMGSPEGGENIVQFNQDVFVYRCVLKDGQAIKYALKSGRGAWLQMVKGQLTVLGATLSAGDGAAIENQEELVFKAEKDTEFLLFDLM